ncbi:MAG: C1 family peptidase [bacterium]
MKRVFAVSLIFLLVTSLSMAVTIHRDKLIFVEDKDAFLDQMKQTVAPLEKGETKKVPKMVLPGIEVPKSVAAFHRSWYFPSISQGITGSCWCFSATSYFESEIYRLSKREIKLSEMYTIYWEYVEKARRFVQQRGDSVFSLGSEPNAVIRNWKKYGVVPQSSYPGKRVNDTIYYHTQMFKEMDKYLESVKQQNIWNEQEVIVTIQSTLNYYMGEPPSLVEVDGKEYTPQAYLKTVLQLNLDDYQDVMSLMQQPYHQKVEYGVNDNWWHSQDYLNVPLDKFMQIIKTAIRKGYTVCIVGDITESGYLPLENVAVVPTYDIPAEYIDENARQIRFSTRKTTDDHAIHLVGYLVKDGKDWYLIKDSGSTARNGKKQNQGYFFFSEDYVKLKMMNLIVHKDILNEVK